MRKSRDELAMAQAWLMAEQGTCPSLQVGCVFTRDGRTLVSGYNGAPRGLPHCMHQEWTWPTNEVYVIPPAWVLERAAQLIRVEASESMGPGMTIYYDGKRTTLTSSLAEKPSCATAEHSERNAIAFAARHGIQLEDSTCVVTHMPCLACAMALVNAGVTRVLYQVPYRITTGIELLRDAGLVVDQFALAS